MQLNNAITGEVIKARLSESNLRLLVADRYDNEGMANLNKIPTTYRWRINPDLSVIPDGSLSLLQCIIKAAYDFVLSQGNPELDGFELSDSRNWLRLDRSIMLVVDKEFAYTELLNDTVIGARLKEMWDENAGYRLQRENSFVMYLENITAGERSAIESLSDYLILLENT